MATPLPKKKKALRKTYTFRARVFGKGERGLRTVPPPHTHTPSPSKTVPRYRCPLEKMDPPMTGPLPTQSEARTTFLLPEMPTSLPFPSAGTWGSEAFSCPALPYQTMFRYCLDPDLVRDSWRR